MCKKGRDQLITDVTLNVKNSVAKCKENIKRIILRMAPSARQDGISTLGLPITWLLISRMTKPTKPSALKTRMLSSFQIAPSPGSALGYSSSPS